MTYPWTICYATIHGRQSFCCTYSPGVTGSSGHFAYLAERRRKAVRHWSSAVETVGWFFVLWHSLILHLINTNLGISGNLRGIPKSRNNCKKSLGSRHPVNLCVHFHCHHCRLYQEWKFGFLLDNFILFCITWVSVVKQLKHVNLVWDGWGFLQPTTQ